MFFAPPMIPGYSVSSDIELNMQDKTGGTLDHFFEVVKSYTAALEARPEINSAKTTFNPSFPQYQLDIDAAACKKAGISRAIFFLLCRDILEVCMLLTSTVSVRCIV